MPAQRLDVALDHYRDRERLVGLTDRAMAGLWAEVNPNRISESWAALIPEATAVISGAQLGAARPAESYIDNILAEQDIVDEPVAAVNPAGFSGQASDARGLVGLLTNPVVVTLMSIQDGMDVAHALGMGGHNLSMLSTTQVADAGRLADQVAITPRKSVSGYTRLAVGNSCSRCLLLAGKFYQWSAGFQRHPRCFPAGTVVSGPATLAASRRWYDGELVVLTTASGQKLSLTANHPVLTSRGWVPAHLLNEGDDVVRSTRPGGPSALQVPDQHQMPALVEDVWATVGVVRTQGHGRTHDFHGDGQDGEVDVVYADRALSDWEHPAFLQQFGEATLTGRVIAASRLFGERPPVLVDLRDSAHSGGPVRSGGLRLPFDFVHPGRAHEAGRAGIAALYAMGNQALRDDVAADAVLAAERILARASLIGCHDLFLGQDDVPSRWDAPADPFTVENRDAYAEIGRDLFDRLSGQVEPDRIVELRRVDWSGHVYSLTSDEGWHSANSLIVGNCDCIHIPAGIANAGLGPLQQSARSIYDRMTVAERIRAGFTRADQRAIADGADLSQVVNARARNSLRVAGERNVAFTSEGGAGRAGLFRVDPQTGHFVPRALQGQRWSVDEIYRVSSDPDLARLAYPGLPVEEAQRQLAIDLLGEFSYLTPSMTQPTLRELRQQAKALGLRNYSDQSRRQIVQRLEALQPKDFRPAAIVAKLPRGGAPTGVVPATSAARAGELARVADRLRFTTSVAETRAVLGEVRTVGDLREVARLTGTHVPARATRKQVEDEIVKHTIGGEITSNAITGLPLRVPRPEWTPLPERVPRATKAAKAAAPDLTGARGLSSDPAVRAVQIENRVREAYRQIPKNRQRWVNIADIREHPALAGLDRAEVDRALKGLVGQRGAFLEPEMNQSALTARDRAAAVRTGGENVHFVKLEDPSPRPLPAAAAPAKATKKAVPRKAPAAPEPWATDLAAQLRTATSREEARALLEPLTVPKMRQVADAAGVALPSRATRTKVLDEIVQWTTGRRLVGEAIQGHVTTGVRSLAIDTTSWRSLTGEARARARQAVIDVARPRQELLSQVLEDLGNGADAAVIRRRLEASARRLAVEPEMRDRLLRAIDSGDISAEVERLAAESGITLVGRATEVQAFDRSTMQAIDGTIEPGIPVVVVRPGALFDPGDGSVTLSKAVVEPASASEAAAFRARVVAERQAVEIPGVATGRDVPDVVPLSRNSKSLTAAERDALDVYKGTLFDDVNRVLRAAGSKVRGLLSSQRRVDRLIATLDGLMSRSRLQRSAELWRGVEAKATRRLFGDRIDGDLTGFTWTERSYASTSFESEQGVLFARLDSEQPEAVGVVLRVVTPEGTGGVYMLSEGEILLQRDLTMRIARDHGVVEMAMPRYVIDEPVRRVRLLDVEVVPQTATDVANAAKREAARVRQAAIEAVQPKAESLADLGAVLATNPHDLAAHLDVIAARGALPKVDVTSLKRAIASGDPVKVQRAIDRVSTKLGVRGVTQAGDITTMRAGFDVVGGHSIPAGAQVRVVRRGTEVAVNGEVVVLSRPLVREVTNAEIGLPSRDVPSLTDIFRDAPTPGEIAQHARTMTSIEYAQWQDDLPQTQAIRQALDGTYGGLRVSTTNVRVRGGAPDEAMLNFTGEIFDAQGRQVGEFIRTIKLDDQGRIVAHHSELSIDPALQGSGFAKAFNDNLLDWYRRSGVHRVELTANIDVGGYAWARAGYDFKDADAARVFVEDSIRKVDQVYKDMANGYPLAKSAPGIKSVAELDRLRAYLAKVQSGQIPAHAADIAAFGRRKGQTGKAAIWSGKWLMLGSGWKGVLYL